MSRRIDGGGATGRRAAWSNRRLPALLVAAVVVVVVGFAAAPAEAAIDGSYFDQNGVQRAYFTGNVVKRIDANIDFNFGTGSPAPGIGSDDFSIVWQGDLIPPNSGDYRLETQSDDGIRVYVDNALVIDNFTDHSPTTDQSPLLTFVAGQRYFLRVEFYERGGGAVARLRWEGPGIANEIVPAGFLERSSFRVLSAAHGCGDNTVTVGFTRRLDPVTAANPGNYVFSGGVVVRSATLLPSGTDVILTVSALSDAGHTITLNNLKDVDGNNLPANTTVQSVAPGNGLSATYYDQNGVQRAYFTGNEVKRVDPTIAFDWGTGIPAAGIGNDDFSVRWTGRITPPTSGNYRFYTRSDDGVRLYLDGALVIDNFTDHAPTVNQSALLPLTAGQNYELEMEYYERGGGAVAELDWEGPGIARDTIPSAVLTPACAAPAAPPSSAFWPFEEATWQGLADEVVDAGGSGYDGRAVNGADTTIDDPALPGSPGTCRYGEFDGTAHQEVRVPYDSGLNPDGSFTVAAWARVRPGVTGFRALVNSRVRIAPGATRRGFNIYAASNNTWQFWTGTGSSWDIVNGGPVQGDRWVHVAVVFEAAQRVGLAWRGTKRVYIDGVQSASASDRNYRPNHLSDFQVGAGGDGNNAPDFFFNGDIDEVRVYSRALAANEIVNVMNTARPCRASIDHYAISHAGIGVTCEAAAVTITGHAPAPPPHGAGEPNETIAITTTPATVAIALASGTPGNFVGGTGSAQYTFAPGETAVGLWLAQTTPALVDIDVVGGGARTEAAGEDALLDFRDTAFRFYADGVADAIGSQVAGKDSNLAPGAQAVTLRAVRTNTDTGACEARLLPAPVDVDLAFECLDPGSCALPLGVTVNGSAVSGNPQGALTNWLAVPLDFGADGTAPLTLNYADAGRIALHARLDLPAAAPEPAVTLAGASNPFVVRPAGLCVEATTPGADCVSGDVTCTPFRHAGETFSMDVRGVAWEAAGETDAAFCSGNATTPNFRLDDIALTPARVAPAAGGSDGVLARGLVDVTIGGTVSVVDQAQSEVGVFTVSATPPSYLGEVIAPSRSANIGRFYPARLAVVANLPTLAAACGGFTYQDQPFGYALAPVLTVQGLNLAGQVTANYGDDFYRLDTTLPRASADDRGGIAATLAATIDAGLTVAGDEDFDGTATLTLDAGPGGDAFVYQRQLAEGPFDAAVDLSFEASGLTDLDGACYDPDQDDVCDALELPDLAGTELRFGRLRLASAFGSDLLPLTLPVVAEYHDGTSFVTNAADTCTTLTLAGEVRLSNPGTAGGAAQDGTVAMQVGGGTSSIGSGDVNVIAGLGQLVFSAPGAGNTGFIDVTTALLANFSWLLFDWDGDGDYDDEPDARASFGLFPGREELIYQREPWD
ncbi:MAG: DUF6701 domain-containing protein [Gammaproteobacteria bacterium]